MNNSFTSFSISHSHDLFCRRRTCQRRSSCVGYSHSRRPYQGCNWFDIFPDWWYWKWDMFGFFYLVCFTLFDWLISIAPDWWHFDVCKLAWLTISPDLLEHQQHPFWSQPASVLEANARRRRPKKSNVEVFIFASIRCYLGAGIKKGLWFFLQDCNWEGRAAVKDFIARIGGEISIWLQVRSP